MKSFNSSLALVFTCIPLLATACGGAAGESESDVDLVQAEVGESVSVTFGSGIAYQMTWGNGNFTDAPGDGFLGWRTLYGQSPAFGLTSTSSEKTAYAVLGWRAYTAPTTGTYTVEAPDRFKVRGYIQGTGDFTNYGDVVLEVEAGVGTNVSKTSYPVYGLSGPMMGMSFDKYVYPKSSFTLRVSQGQQISYRARLVLRAKGSGINPITVAIKGFGVDTNYGPNTDEPVWITPPAPQYQFPAR